jgi:predicted Zn-ribbon and HTH transcriptional regulator
VKDRPPKERAQSLRAALEDALRMGPATTHQLSVIVSMKEKDVADHLEHIAKSAKAHGEKLVVAPAECMSCGFVFEDRKKLTKPGSCPSCKKTRITTPRFSLESTGG